MGEAELVVGQGNRAAIRAGTEMQALGFHQKWSRKYLKDFAQRGSSAEPIGLLRKASFLGRAEVCVVAENAAPLVISLQNPTGPAAAKRLPQRPRPCKRRRGWDFGNGT